MEIICEWAEKNRYLQNFNGQIYPCCYLVQTQTQKVFNGTNRPEKQEVLNKYNEVKDELNIFNNDIETILSHEWFTKTLPESWDDPDKTLDQCTKHCGVKK
tara:strand:- start:31 stop:333 length:303 start_codon:yes stop_codon:yes gene_type:complete